jgi:predicted metal-dependent phosphoesterase TrpH
VSDAGRPDAGWRPRDCHAHTTFSDGHLTPEALVAAAAARGARPSIADHCSRDVAFALKDVPALETYVARLERLRDEAAPDLA